jgi:predicted AAA+ superfamily ATPase
MSILDTLIRWNTWGSFNLKPGLKREITPTILNAIGVDQVIVLKGPRRTGKSTVLYQVIDYLISSGADPKSILHVNFEDPALALDLSVALLDKVYDEYRTHIYPSGKVYLFFDEIQRITDWERWVRSRNETEDLKIFITGSSAQLLSRELATLLTGRHLSFTILPLNFREYLYFRNIENPQNSYSHKAPPEISNALVDYLTYGGYPGIALIDRKLELNGDITVNKKMLKKQILLEYFDDLLFKDVALRHQIRDLTLLRNLAIHMLTNTAGFINYNKLSNKLLASSDVMKDYCSYLCEAYLIDLMQIFSLKITERSRNDQKIHAIDIGVRNALSISNSEDFGKNIETVVHNNLRIDLLDNIYYYKDDKCDIDLLVHRNNEVTKLVQVTYQGLDDPKTSAREINALQLGMKRFASAEAELIVCNFPADWQEISIPKNINVTPLWKFLLGKEQ